MPVVRASAVIACMVPPVAESAVRRIRPVPAYAPVVVMFNPFPAMAAPMTRSMSSPPARRLAPPPVMERPVPVVWPVMEMDWPTPTVEELAVMAKNVAAPVLEVELMVNKVPVYPTVTPVWDMLRAVLVSWDALEETMFTMVPVPTSPVAETFKRPTLEVEV